MEVFRAECRDSGHEKIPSLYSRAYYPGHDGNLTNFPIPNSQFSSEGATFSNIAPHLAIRAVSDENWELSIDQILSRPFSSARLYGSVYFQPSARYSSERTRRYEYTYDFSSSGIVTPVIELTPVVSAGLNTFQRCIWPVAIRRRDTMAEDCTLERRCMTYSHWSSLLQRMGASGSSEAIVRGGPPVVG